jgi:hypothetical protein
VGDVKNRILDIVATCILWSVMLPLIVFINLAFLVVILEMWLKGEIEIKRA